MNYDTPKNIVDYINMKKYCQKCNKLLDMYDSKGAIQYQCSNKQCAQHTLTDIEDKLMHMYHLKNKYNEFWKKIIKHINLKSIKTFIIQLKRKDFFDLKFKFG